MKKKNDWLLGLVALMAAVGSIIIIALAIRDSEEQRIERMEYNVDSLRRAHQELKLKTLEDSVHYYEDGM